MKLKFTRNQIATAASRIINEASSKIMNFHAPMGAGKTTLIKALVKELGAIDSGSSPTFGIVNEYHDLKGELLAYHFDFYRLEEETEALDMGLEDYLNQDVWIFIEWPEKISSFLPDNATDIFIKIIDGDTREVKVVN